MRNTIKRNEIYAKINEIPNSFFGMTYIKADGSVREAIGRLRVKNPKHTLVPGTGAYLGESAQEALKNHNNLKYFDCGIDGNPRYGQEFGKGDYRTAKIENIIRIRINGIEYEVID